MSDKKCVKFNLNDTIFTIHHWLYAHKKARENVWGQIAIDQLHFKRRIQKMECILNPVLEKKILEQKINKNIF